MQKEKTIRTYQRRTKSGKMVTVKQHSAKYDAAEALKEAAKKQGAGSELEAKKKATPSNKGVSDVSAEEYKKWHDWLTNESTGSGDKGIYKGEAPKNKALKAVHDKLHKHTGDVKKYADSVLESGESHKDNYKKIAKPSDKHADLRAKIDSSKVSEATKKRLHTSLNNTYASKSIGSTVKRRLDKAVSQASSKTAPKSSPISPEDFKAWYHWDTEADPKNKTALGVEKALKAKMGNKGYKEYFNKMTDSYSARGHSKAYASIEPEEHSRVKSAKMVAGTARAQAAVSKLQGNKEKEAHFKGVAKGKMDSIKPKKFKMSDASDIMDTFNVLEESESPRHPLLPVGRLHTEARKRAIQELHSKYGNTDNIPEKELYGTYVRHAKNVAPGVTLGSKKTSPKTTSVSKEMKKVKEYKKTPEGKMANQGLSHKGKPTGSDKFDDAYTAYENAVATNAPKDVLAKLKKRYEGLQIKATSTSPFSTSKPKKVATKKTSPTDKQLSALVAMEKVETGRTAAEKSKGHAALKKMGITYENAQKMRDGMLEGGKSKVKPRAPGKKPAPSLPKGRVRATKKSPWSDHSDTGKHTGPAKPAKAEWRKKLDSYKY